MTERNRRILTTTIAALSLLACAGCAVPQPRGAGKLERIVEPTTKRGYWLYLPKEYVQADEAALHARRWPVVVSFHGMKPFDNAHSQAREWEQEADRYGYVVIAPELRAPDVLGQFPLRTITSALAGDETATLAILDHVFASTRADPSNVLSTGWSSGGYMSHYMLNRHPDRFTCLGVRQSNFSSTVLDPDLTRRSRYHPIFIVNTQNDFAICKRESREAVEWYESHGYRNVAWIIIKDKGHERTPDLAADFFSRVAGVRPNTPPVVLARRQAIDGNPEGIALLSGVAGKFEAAPSAHEEMGQRIAVHVPPTPHTNTTPPRTLPDMTTRGLPPSTDSHRTDSTVSQDANDRTAAIPSQPRQRSPLNIRVSSAIGIVPLHLGFSAECPANWYESADFHWTLDGEQIASGVNGQKTLTKAGVHALSLLVVTSDGREFRAKRTVRVLPRLDDTTASSALP